MINSQIVNEMANHIVECFNPQRIIAFGSWARGETTLDSDIDFLVVMPYEGSKRDCQVAIRRALKHFKMPKDIIVASDQELSDFGMLNGYIYKTALSEGVVIYDEKARRD